MGFIIQNVTSKQAIFEEVLMERFRNTLGVVAIVAAMVSGLCNVLGTGADLVEHIKK